MRNALLAAALLAATSASALQVRPRAFPNQGVFGIEVAGSDVGFYARADQVLSVSFQEYTTGSFIVAEVTVDMANSGQQLRIYSARPPGTADAADRVNRGLQANAQNRGLEPGQATQVPVPGPLGVIEQKLDNLRTKSTDGLVVKPWPTATHAKTVEMTVASRAEILAFYRIFRDLMVAREVRLATGSTGASAATPAQAGTVFGTQISGANARNTPAPAASAGQGPTINRIGGTLFVLE
jgi:hypothetical protein